MHRTGNRYIHGVNDEGVSAGQALPLQSGQSWPDYLADILGRGKGQIHDLDDAAFAEAGRLQNQPARERLGQYFLRIGELLSSAAAIEDYMELLAAFLLNPHEPGRATPAMKSLSARTTRELAATLLRDRWPAVTPVFAECQKIASKRNEVAHNALADMWPRADGSLERSVYIEVGRMDNSSYSTRRVILTLDTLDEWIDRANLAATVLVQLLIHLALAAHANRVLAPSIELFDIFTSGQEGSGLGLSARDQQLFRQYYDLPKSAEPSDQGPSA
jgi:hypothetical protein